MMARLSRDHAVHATQTDADCDDTYVTSALDALEDGDLPFRPGSARAALSHATFRRVFIGAFLSNIGSWMQNVVLGALAYDLTQSPTRNLVKVTRVGLVLFAGFLAAFALVRSPATAYVAVTLVGIAYFAVITSLSTVLQQQLDDSSRDRVMALWIMGFGGTVPIGNLLAGPVIEASSITVVVLIGAAVAVVLAWCADLSAAPVAAAAVT